LPFKFLGWLYWHYEQRQKAMGGVFVLVAAVPSLIALFLLLAGACLIDYGVVRFIPRPIPDQIWPELIFLFAWIAVSEWYVRSRREAIIASAKKYPPPQLFRDWPSLWIWGVMMVSFAAFFGAAMLATGRL
jgi:hypothetical protein